MNFADILICLFLLRILLSREKEKNKLIKNTFERFSIFTTTCKELVSHHLHFHNRKNAEQTENQHFLNSSEN